MEFSSDDHIIAQNEQEPVRTGQLGGPFLVLSSAPKKFLKYTLRLFSEFAKHFWKEKTSEPEGILVTVLSDTHKNRAHPTHTGSPALKGIRSMAFCLHSWPP